MIEVIKDKTSAETLVANLLTAKKELIASKKIMNKKDKHVYPISDNPFDIPNNWQWVFLSDISIIQEGPGIRKHQYQDDGIQFLTVTNILEGSVDLFKSQKYVSYEEYQLKYKHYTINKGDIVTACSGGSWGKSAIYTNDDQLMLNTSTLRLRFFDDLGDNNYLYYLTKSIYFKANLASHSTGQQANYGYSHYSKIPIPLPPLQVQKKIVVILNKAFEAIEQSKANLELNIIKAKELFQSKLNEIFSQKGEGWEEKTLGEVASLKGRIGWKGLTAKEYVDEGPLFLSVHSLNYGDLVDFQDAFHITNERYEESPEIMLQSGDILICKDGAGIGKLAMVGKLPGKTTVNSSLLVIRKGESILTKYLYFSLLSPFFQKIVQDRLQGSTTPHLYQRDITTFPIFLPPLKEQPQIVEVMDKLNSDYHALINRYSHKVQNLTELKKSILQKAFAGELTNKEVVV